jgi:hypothetical protein
MRHSRVAGVILLAENLLRLLVVKSKNSLDEGSLSGHGGRLPRGLDI